MYAEDYFGALLRKAKEAAHHSETPWRSAHHRALRLNMDKRENEIVNRDPAEDAPAPERNGPDRER